MANYNIKGKLEQLSELLKESDCRHNRQIMDLIQSIVYGAVDARGNYRDEIYNLYNNLFFSKASGKDMGFDAYRLDIKNVRSKIMLINSENTSSDNIIQELFESIISSREGQNYLIPVRDGFYAVVYEINAEDDTKEFALAMIESVMNELGINIAVGTGLEYFDILDAGRSYKEAETALDAGKMLLGKPSVYEYDKLGVAKLVYRMTDDECTQFLNDSFSEEALRELNNKEILESINVFFDCDLNISVAARELYVHRNTLVYRIEKFKKVSGYDLSNFDDAVIVRLALMIRRRSANDKI